MHKYKLWNFLWGFDSEFFNISINQGHFGNFSQEKSVFFYLGLEKLSKHRSGITSVLQLYTSTFMIVPDK